MVYWYMGRLEARHEADVDWTGKPVGCWTADGWNGPWQLVYSILLIADTGEAAGAQSGLPCQIKNKTLN
jgi:hypothetical protein